MSDYYDRQGNPDCGNTACICSMDAESGATRPVPDRSQVPAGTAASLAVLFTATLWFAYGLAAAGLLTVLDAPYWAVVIVMVLFCLAAATHICFAWEKHTR